jgi:virulence-associated protein VagC
MKTNRRNEYKTPLNVSWDALIHSLTEFSDDFLAEREQPLHEQPPQEDSSVDWKKSKG